MKAIINLMPSRCGLLKTYTLLFLCISAAVNATIWYAAPGASLSGSGSYNDPIDLQTALNSPSIHPGDILYLKSGTYVGRFVCTLAGDPTKKITVMSEPRGWAILDGHVTHAPTTEQQVLRSAASNVIFKDFEVTYSGVIRVNTQPGYATCSGVTDSSGSHYCEFINLVIHDNPGDGFNCWKEAESSFVYGCLIYNNGVLTPGEERVQHGPGLYVQNQYKKYKIFKNNIVFNNFWLGFEVWSASTTTDLPFVQYVTLDDNTAFNNGMPASRSGYGEANILVKTMDTNGSNIIRNVNIVNNTLYQNTTYLGPDPRSQDATIFTDDMGETPALEVGNITPRFPSDSIYIAHNFLSGRNPAVRINDVNDLTFFDNIVLGRYVEIKRSNRLDGRINASNWHFDKNTYYCSGDTYRSVPGIWGHKVFRMTYPCGDLTCTEDYWLPGHYDNYTTYIDNLNPPCSPPLSYIPTWKYYFPGLDTNSLYRFFGMNVNADPYWNGIPFYYYNPVNILKVTQNIYKPNQFKVVLLNPPTSNPATGPYKVSVDFSQFEIPEGTSFDIIDVESYPAVAVSGNLANTFSVNFDLNMTAPQFNAPTGPGCSSAQRTPGNFGVFLIEFKTGLCMPDVEIYDAVISGNNDYQQAGNSINASNKINSAATAAYHAPTVVLAPDFYAAGGSNFRAYTDGCTQSYVARVIDQPEQPKPEFAAMPKPEKASAETEFVIHPNPSDGRFKVESPTAIVRMTVTKVDNGKQVFKNEACNSKIVTVDISKEKAGLYIVKVDFTNGTTGTKTFKKN